MSNDQCVQEILETLYGEGAWEISKALTDAEKKEWGRKIGYATNLAGAFAGPAAIAMAIKGRKEGGIPRAAAHGAGNMTRGPRIVRNAGKKAALVARKLDAPGSKGWRRGAGAAGAALIGLQTVNWVGDAVAAKTLKEPKKVQKSDSPQGMKLKLVKSGVNATGTAAKRAPQAINTAKDTVKAGKAPIFSPKKLAQVEVPPPEQYKVESVKKSVSWSVRGEISKMNEEKKQVFGWASVIEVGGEPVIDLQGDVMTIETIEKAAYDYVHKSRKGGRQHQRNGEEPLHVSDMIESFVLTPEKKEKMGLPDSTPTGWWVGFQVNDDDTWQAYKDGKLKEFSIHGSGTRKALEV